MASNAIKAEPGWPPVVVAGAYYTGVALMRNLARRGVRVFCVDYTPKQPGFYTVYGPAYCCPNPDRQPAEWLYFMVKLGTTIASEAGNKPALISSSDRFLTAIAQDAGKLETYFTFCISAVAAQALLATKQRQYDMADAHGLPVSRTQFVQSLEEVLAFGDKARFPCLLKPLHFREWQQFPSDHPLRNEKLALVPTREKLEATYRLASQVNPRMVIQEVIEGPDTAKLVYLSCYNRKSERIANCMVRQVRTAPIYFGSASVVEPASDPEADALCDRFLRGIQYAGICEIELKRDSRDGRVKMIEANPRFSVTADSALGAGVDIGWIHYLDLIGQPVTPVAPEPRDFRHIVLIRDFATIRSYRRAGLLTWRELIRSYRPPVAFFDFDWRDWRVTASVVSTLFRLIVGPPLRRIFPKLRSSWSGS